MKYLDNKGFTIVEVVITLTLVGVLMAIFLGFVTNSLITYGIAGARSGMLADARTAVDIISTDIRLSSVADLNNRWPDPNAPNAPTNEYSWQSDGDTLILAAAAQDNARNIIFADASQYISEKNNYIYYLQDSRLIRRVLAAPHPDNAAKTSCPPENATPSCPADKVLIDNIRDFSIRYYDAVGSEVSPDTARSVQVYLELEEQVYSQDVSVDYTTRTVFRND